MGLPVPVCKGCIEMLDVDRSHIMSHPFIKDPGEELPILFRSDGQGGYGTAFSVTFHYRDKLDKLCLYHIAEEAVDFTGMIPVDRIDGAQDVEVHLVLFQAGDSLHHAVKRSFSSLVSPAGIVQFPRPVDTDTH